MNIVSMSEAYILIYFIIYRYRFLKWYKMHLLKYIIIKNLSPLHGALHEMGFYIAVSQKVASEKVEKYAKIFWDFLVSRFHQWLQFLLLLLYSNMFVKFCGVWPFFGENFLRTK